ncbi:hypothetical protein AB6T94_13080 [Klebsiella pneumoniae]
MFNYGFRNSFQGFVADKKKAFQATNVLIKKKKKKKKKGMKIKIKKGGGGGGGGVGLGG